MTQSYDIAVHTHDSNQSMGAAAGAEVVRLLKEAIELKGAARLMLAAAPSQLTTLEAVARSDLQFDLLTCYHMDDYIGLAPDAIQGFGNWLDSHFFTKLPSQPRFHRIDTLASPEESASQYSSVMGDEPFDVTLCGLGVNAHLAFNDPPANFRDPLTARVVQLDDVSRQQQVDEGHFPQLDDVPAHAITVTIPRLLETRNIICCVPGTPKKAAVAATLNNPPDPSVPGSALKLHPRAQLYLDQESAPQR